MKKKNQESAKQLSRLKILFADDELPLQELMKNELPRMGHDATICPDGGTALAALERNSYDCVVVDLDMPGMSGVEVIAHVKKISPDTETVILTGKASQESAIAALKHGAFDYLTKPCRLSELSALLQRVADRREVTRRFHALQRMLERATGKSEMVGNSPAIEQAKLLISKVAPSNSSVLVLGETGVGKELVARAVHEQSARADQPFVAVNCGALPENLIESELFGHRKGSFTGADEHRAGLFEVASGGTLFLDEIGELPKAVQAKLLRVLETGEVRRVGENQTFQIDVRLICATHRDLVKMVEAEEFREDLMYRINTFEIHVPPLRSRTTDIPQLAEVLCRRYRSDLPKEMVLFAPETMAAFQAHHWPGNVREMANVIEHALIICDQFPILPSHLPRHFDSRKRPTPRLGETPLTLRELEAIAIESSMERHHGNKVAAAEELGVSVKTLYNKLNTQPNQESKAA
jgi:DNA-binding NtrC family response regulator